MREIQFSRFFPDMTSAEEACNRIEAEIEILKAPRSKRNEVWQRVLKDAVIAYIREARATPNQAKKWRSIAEAMFWWANAFSVLSNKPFCQQMGANKNKTKADKSALSAVRTWQKVSAHAQRLSGLSETQVIEEYLKRARPTRRQADRLRGMLKSGVIK